MNINHRDYTTWELSLDDSFNFACHAGVPCFNECCGDLNQFLTAYDVLQLKTGLGLSATDFLQQYTHSHLGAETGLVVVTLKKAAENPAKCPFLTADGCRVYPFRPSSCRIYPLVRIAARCRATGEIQDRFWLMKEPHCRGFEQGQSQTVRQWIKNQGLEEYNRMNDLMMAILADKNRLCPQKPLDGPAREIFYLGCYDMDRFRREVFESETWDPTGYAAEQLSAARTQDTALLTVALTWVRRQLFPAVP